MSNIIKHLMKLLEENKVEKLGGWDLWRVIIQEKLD